MWNYKFNFRDYIQSLTGRPGKAHRPTYLIFQNHLLRLSWWKVAVLVDKSIGFPQFPGPVIVMYTFPGLFSGAIEIWAKAVSSRRRIDEAAPI